jgi:hypothetical protein
MKKIILINGIYTEAEILDPSQIDPMVIKNQEHSFDRLFEYERKKFKKDTISIFVIPIVLAATIAALFRMG